MRVSPMRRLFPMPLFPYIHGIPGEGIDILPHVQYVGQKIKKKKFHRYLPSDTTTAPIARAKIAIMAGM